MREGQGRLKERGTGDDQGRLRPPPFVITPPPCMQEQALSRPIVREGAAAGLPALSAPPPAAGTLAQGPATLH